MRTFTPIQTNPDLSRRMTLQRCCNGCGRVLGDLNDSELQAIDYRSPAFGVLPDVRGECPTCNPRPLVGPVKRVVFQYGPRATSVNYDVPANTGDSRYALCLDHHVACDCREADLAELIGELRGMLRQFDAAFDAVLSGHPTGSSYDPDTNNCQCTGCRIARAAGYHPKGTTL
jgi:hypothetical protein